MKLKSMLKFALSALLLSAGFSAFAADGDGETPTAPATGVVLKNGTGTTVTWAEFAAAVNAGKDNLKPADDSDVAKNLATAQAAYNTANQASQDAAAIDLKLLQAKVNAAQDEYDSISNRLDSLKDARSNLPKKFENQAIGWLQAMINKAESCMNAWSEVVQGHQTSETISYACTTSGRINLYLLFGTISSGTITVGSGTSAQELTVNTVTLNEFEEFLYPNGVSSPAKTFSNIFVYLGPNQATTSGGTAPNTLSVSVTSSVDQIIPNAYTVLDTQASKDGFYSEVPTEKYRELTEDIVKIEGGKYTDKNGKEITVLKADGTLAIAKSKLDTAKNALADAQNEKTDAPAKLSAAKENLETAQKAYDAAVTTLKNEYDANYGVVRLNGDVTADAAITVDYAGRIYGQGNILNITVPQLFTHEFTGTLNNAAVYGGSFAQSFSSAKIEDVAYWNGASAYRFYGDNGVATSYSSLGALGFAARDYFGVDLKAKAFKHKDVATAKVYSIKVYNTSTGTPSFVNLTKDNTFNNGGASDLTVAPNTFIESATGEVSAGVAEPIVAIPNVIFNNVCENVVITDKKAFFAPYEFTANNVTMTRNFTAGVNTVCLPFAMSEQALNDKLNGEKVNYLATYDTETKTDFWFTVKDEETIVPANTPVLLNAKDAFTLNLSDIIIAKTDKQLNKLVSENDGESFGTLATYSSNDILEESQVNRVYGYVPNDGLFQPAGVNASFPAFRMAVTTNVTTPDGAPRRISLKDERGIVIAEGTTGIEEITAADEAAAFSIATGVGEIVFTSEADFGKVEVYSLDGKVVAVADIMAGNTYVNVAKGLYIVMGKKVMVK